MVCCPHNRTVKSLVHLTLSARLCVFSLPLNRLAYGWLDTINASFDKGREARQKHLTLK